MKNQYHHIIGPIGIGGVGGSGTRVVAEILMTFGFYMGNDLNRPKDNLLYTLLFKRPKWFIKNFKNKSEIENGITLFHKLMLSIGTPSLPESVYLLKAVVSMARYGHNADGKGNGSWYLERLKRAVSKQDSINPAHIGWGWKEPNTHLLVENFTEHFQDFKYVHTIRHGLDMAFSNNQQQLYNWGPLFGVSVPVSRTDEPKASLKYWVRANNQVIQAGKRLGEERFLLMDFDDLCSFPNREIDRLVNFLGIKVNKDVFESVLHLPKTPQTKGRYKLQDLGQFNEEDLSMLTHLGYSIEQ